MKPASLALAAALVLPALALPALALASVTVIFNPDSDNQRSRTFRDTNAHIHLGEGEEALVLSDGDSSETIEGPYDGPLADALSSSRSHNEERGDAGWRVASLFTMVRDRRDHTGAVRGDKTAPEPEVPAGVGLLAVSLDTDQKQCFLNLPVQLWRYDATSPGPVVLSQAGGHATTLSFDATGHFATWPQSVGLSGQNGTYVVSYLDGKGTTHIFTLAALQLDDPKDLKISTLLDQGCDYQAEIAAKNVLAHEEQ